MKLEQVAKQLEALGNPTRLQVYRLLVRAGDAGCPVGRIQERLDIPASTWVPGFSRIAPATPRAIVLNDAVAVGFSPAG